MHFESRVNSRSTGSKERAVRSRRTTGTDSLRRPTFHQTSRNVTTYQGGLTPTPTPNRIQVSWSPHIPAVVATCSFDRKVQLFSMNGAKTSNGRAPTWHRRAAGASFGFGGRLVSFSKGADAQGQQVGGVFFRVVPSGISASVSAPVSISILVSKRIAQRAFDGFDVCDAPN